MYEFAIVEDTIRINGLHMPVIDPVPNLETVKHFPDKGTIDGEAVKVYWSTVSRDTQNLSFVFSAPSDDSYAGKTIRIGD